MLLSSKPKNSFLFQQILNEHNRNHIHPRVGWKYLRQAGRQLERKPVKQWYALGVGGVVGSCYAGGKLGATAGGWVGGPSGAIFGGAFGAVAGGGIAAGIAITWIPQRVVKSAPDYDVWASKSIEEEVKEAFESEFNRQASPSLIDDFTGKIIEEPFKWKDPIGQSWYFDKTTIKNCNLRNKDGTLTHPLTKATIDLRACAPAPKKGIEIQKNKIAFIDQLSKNVFNKEVEEVLRKSREEAIQKIAQFENTLRSIDESYTLALENKFKHDSILCAYIDPFTQKSIDEPFKWTGSHDEEIYFDRTTIENPAFVKEGLLGHPNREIMLNLSSFIYDPLKGIEIQKRKQEIIDQEFLKTSREEYKQVLEKLNKKSKELYDKLLSEEKIMKLENAYLEDKKEIERLRRANLEGQEKILRLEQEIERLKTANRENTKIVMNLLKRLDKLEQDQKLKDSLA